MKKFKKLCLILMAVSFIPISIFTNDNLPDEGCLKLLWENECVDSVWNSVTHKWNYTEYKNPDSILVDSCKTSSTYGEWFAKRYFRLQFNPSATTSSHNYPFDIVLDTNQIAEINDISSYKTNLKQQFQILETMFGSFHFKGLEVKRPDSNYYYNPRVDLYFDNYQNIDSVLYYFERNIDSLKGIYYLSLATKYTDINENIINFRIYPNPAKSIINIPFKQNFGIKYLQLFNVQGILIKKEKYQDIINIADLPKGLYFIRYGDEVAKFIKE